MPTNEIQLHDIKPLIEIQEYSFYYFSALIALAVLILIGLLYLGWRWFANRNKFDIRAEHLALLKKIDFNNAKSDAYKITLYGATFKNDSERHERAYQELVEKLEDYKYKKSVASFSDESRDLLEKIFRTYRCLMVYILNFLV